MMFSRSFHVRRRLAIAGSGLFILCARGERLFVGIWEADSYQSVIYGASAFSRVADMPYALETTQASLTRNLAVPGFAGLSGSAMLRIVQTVDPSLPLSDDNPANVALIPLVDRGDAVRAAFLAAYTRNTPSPPLTVFDKPSDTNLAPHVAIAVDGRHLLTSRSKDALLWAWNNREKLINAPPQSLPGTFRVLVNPQRLADLWGSRGEKAARILNVEKLIRDFDTLTLAMTLEGQAISLTLRGAPKSGSALETLTAACRAPAPSLWNGLPDNAFFASVSACGRPDLWEPYLNATTFRLLNFSAQAVPQTALTGETLWYLSPGKDRKTLSLVQIAPRTQTNAAPNAILRPFGVADTNPDIRLTPKPERQIPGARIRTYAISLVPPSSAVQGKKTEEMSAVFTLLSLFLKKAVLEQAVTDRHLITVLGPEKSIDEQLAALTFNAQALNLGRKISAQDAALTDPLTTGASLHAVDLLRYLVSLMPDITPEQLQRLPFGGDGVTFGICKAGRTVTASLRIYANEIAALQRVNRDSREVLQELFFQMFARQVMDQQQIPAGK